MEPHKLTFKEKTNEGDYNNELKQCLITVLNCL